MTVSTALKELEKRLSEASGAYEEIDRPLAEAIDRAFPFETDPGTRYLIIQAVRGSLDAAVSLCERVLPGSGWLVGRGRLTPSEPLFGATVYATDMADEPEELGGAEGPSPALALCLAAVRALIAKEKE